MRIAMLGHKRMPSREGGVEVVVEELSTRMASLGHDVSVYSRKGHNVAGHEYNSVDLSEYKGVAIKQVTTIDIKGFAALTSSFFATKAAMRDKPDVIHFHAEGPCAMIPMAKRYGFMTVATIHGLDWQRAKWGRFASRYIKFGERAAAKYADRIIVLSRSVQDYFISEYGRDTIYLPNGVSAQKCADADIIVEKYNLERNGYILFLGRIVPEKGVHYLIEAFKGLSTEMKLVVAGGSSDSKAYFDKVKQSASTDSRILFTGFTQGRELEELYSNAAVYVLPSDLEGMPMSLLEAMSYGRCCLTSDIEECSTVLGETGVTFPRGDVTALRNTLDSLLDNASKLEEFGAAAKRRVDADYNWDNVVRKTIDVYQGVLK